MRVLHFSVVVVVAALTLGASPVHAAPESLSQARIHFDAGETFYRLGQFREALAEYQAALKLTRRPSIIFNIAQCYRQLERHRKALFYYRLYLSDWARLRPGQPAKYHKEVAAHITRLYRLVKKAEASSRPTVRKPDATATPKSGRLRLVGAPAGAELFVDGLLKARAPITGDLELPAGVRRVEVTYEEARPLDRRLELRPGEVRTLRVKVVSRDRPRTTGWLVLGAVGAALAVTSEALALAAMVKGNGLFNDDPDIDTYRNLSYAGHAVAGGMLLTSAAGFVLYALSGGREEAVVPGNLALAPLPGGAWVSGRLTF